VLALTLLAAPGCGPSIVGRACDSTDPCPVHFTCAPAHDGTNRCMRECSLNETVCSDGTVCLPIGSSSMGGACYLGGNVGIGGDCSSDLDCTRTAICLHAGAVAQCRVGCNVDGTHGCSGGFVCLPAVGAGYCGQTM
jgi:hypothetical protein